MAWIRVVEEAEAERDLARLYARMKDCDGRVDNILTIHSLNPTALQTHFDLYKACMYGASELTRAQREMVAVVVSVANECHY